ncbi:MAG: PaaI family thioesterase [Roseitalea sp.]|jgi:uncharacterized protein (TIGR00369 family)|nr:PaaI family thioesterase [Roseitalea sp.]MBO6723837.1 PaaI family thioesterase [Roseitalea sp.]MBO6745373.1 PaaI family thioesterase [Roseitalea sp.]
MDKTHAFAAGIFAAQPFTHLIGAELVAASKGQTEIAVDLRDELRQQHGFAHGGLISYLADNAITFAGGLGLGGDALTSEFKINYVRPARGARLIARATTRSVGRRQAVCTCEIYAIEDGAERLCALAQGTVVAVSG